ncbi:MAG: hypothetical protein IAA31_03655 [Candidatus Anaerobiospirillum merdipullorum]|uniref:Conjugal transfer protein TrbI n=1 Tax=Candidatus Anaerobiospirillum merdipullorum TaxID=2838450 RepID=A0A9E2KNG6_9GAMM|nr:hypothetical protein [Candidatus Anaerobiospirillum merdipullorum]
MEVKNQKVKRGKVTKVPLLIVLGLCLLILIVAALSMPSATDDKLARNEEKEAMLFADARAQIDRLQAATRATADKEELKPEPPAPVKVEPSLDADAYARFKHLQNPAPPPEPTAEERLMQQRTQAFLQALSASSKVELNFNAPSNMPGLNGGGDTTLSGGQALSAKQKQMLQDSKAKLAQLKGQGGGELSAYEALNSGDEHALAYRTESVDTPYLIRQGTVVPAVLLTGINSDIPGQVMAQTTAAVYDSPRGNFALIPAGSRLIGQYLSQPAYGTERVMLAFNRLIFPDGKALTLGAMPAASLDGLAGLEAEVDNHMFRLLSGALLLGGITAMVSVTQDDAYDSDGNLTTSSALTQAMGASLGQVLADVVERNINIAPTLQVPAGFRFNLTLVKDLRFKGPYQDFDYAA